MLYIIYLGRCDCILCFLVLMSGKISKIIKREFSVLDGNDQELKNAVVCGEFIGEVDCDGSFELVYELFDYVLSNYAEYKFIVVDRNSRYVIRNIKFVSTNGTIYTSDEYGNILIPISL